MTPSTAREEALFLLALGQSASDRIAFLERECAGDPALRLRLDALLAAHEQPDTLLAIPGAAALPTSPTIPPHPPDASPGAAVGLIIGPYKLLEHLGEGGCGAVYVAEQTEPVRRRVALKVIKPGMDSRQVLARFEAERQVLAMMDHPNIAKVLDAGTTESGRPYFVMELVRGIRITEYCDQALLTTRQRLDLFIKVCQAIQHAHQKGIIHRDIKPSNILVTLHDGVPVPKVIDFGIAKALPNLTEGLSHATVYTELHQFLGTPAYMSPEQAEMSGLDIDTRSDIYSLGILLYEILVGRTPFAAKELVAAGLDAMRRTIREQEPERPSTKLSTLGGEELTATAKRRGAEASHLIHLLKGDLDWIVMKCLEKDRTRRYETVNGVAADLKRHLNDEPVVARPPSATYKLQKAWKRNRLAFAAGSAIATALVIGLGVSILALLKARADRERVVAAEHNQSIARSLAEVSRLEAVRQRDRAEAELWNSQLSEARALRIAGGPGARVHGSALLRNLVLRPDLTLAQILALRHEAIGQLALVDIALPTNWISRSPLSQVAWDASFERFVRGADSGGLELCAYPSERVLGSFATPPRATVGQAQFTPNDEFLVVRFDNPAQIVWAWRVDTQEVVLQGQGGHPIDVSPDSRSVILLTSRGVLMQPLPAGQPGRLYQPDRQVFAATFSPDMRQLAVLPHSPANSVEVWNAASGETTHSFPVDFPPRQLAWHPDGTRLALGGDRGRLELRTLQANRAGNTGLTGRLPLEGHHGYIERLRFSPDGSTLLTYGWDHSSFLWDLVSGRSWLQEQRTAILAIGSKSDRVIALRHRGATHSESIAALLQRTSFRTVAWAAQHREALGVSISPDGRLAVVSYGPEVTMTEGDCLLWDFARGREVARLKGIWAQFSADSRTLFTFEAYERNRVNRYDVSAETLANPPADWSEGILVYQGRPGEKVNTGVLAADGRTLVIAATETVVFLDTLGQQPPRTWQKSAHAVSLSRDGRWIATMLHHHRPVVWDMRNGRPVFRGELYSSIEFSPDSRWLSFATPSAVRIHALDSLAQAHTTLPLETPGSAAPVAFSPDSRLFAVPLDRTQVRLYESASGRELATLSAPHSAPIAGGRTLNFSADGQWLVAAKNDGETVAWNLPTIRRELAKLNLDWTLSDGVDADPSRSVEAHASLEFHGLFSRPPRDAAAPPRFIDLADYYNATLTEAWHPGSGTSDFSALPGGVQVLAGEQFDIRGLIQLGSQSRLGDPYPLRLTGIEVGLSCQRLHFLHSAITAFGLQTGTRIGSYVVRYRDGTSFEIPIEIGRDVADWWSQDDEDLTGMVVAWSSVNESMLPNGTIRLFKSTWENPRPTAVIQSLDFIASHDRARPFLVAVTADETME